MAQPTGLGERSEQEAAHSASKLNEDSRCRGVFSHVNPKENFVQYVTFSCYKRRRLLDADACKRIVIGALGNQLRKLNGRCLGFVVMPDHVHAMLWFQDENRISAHMDKWKELSSKEIAGFYQRQLPKYWATLEDAQTVWQDRYYDFQIWSETKMREKLEYMHNNPIRAGLVKDICEWPWSSARWWHLRKSVGITIEWVP